MTCVWISPGTATPPSPRRWYPRVPGAWAGKRASSDVISLYAGGMTVRDIRHHLESTLGTDLSPEAMAASPTR